MLISGGNMDLEIASNKTKEDNARPKSEMSIAAIRDWEIVRDEVTQVTIKDVAQVANGFAKNDENDKPKSEFKVGTIDVEIVRDDITKVTIEDQVDGHKVFRNKEENTGVKSEMCVEGVAGVEIVKHEVTQVTTKDEVECAEGFEKKNDDDGPRSEIKEGSMIMKIVRNDITKVTIEDGVEGQNDLKNNEVKSQKDKSRIVVPFKISPLVIPVPIKFVSREIGVPIKEDADADAVTNATPKDVVNEWHEPKMVHSFYFVRVRPYEDPKLKTKIDQAEKEIQKMNVSRLQLIEAIKDKQLERSQIISQLKSSGEIDKQYKVIINDKKKELKPLNQALAKLRDGNRKKGGVLCSSEEELNDLIRNLNYRLQHESNTLVEEKKIIEEIKQFEGSRKLVKENAATRASIRESLGQKEDIQERVKVIVGEVESLRKEKQAITAKIEQLEDDLKTTDNETNSIQEHLMAVGEKREKVHAALVQLRKQRDAGNAYYYQNRSLLKNSRELADNKDIGALEKLSNAEIEKFMSRWNGNKSFREDYEKRILGSLDMRQLSKDGRIRNPNEKPLLEALPTSGEPVKLVKVEKPNVIQPNESPKPASQPDIVPAPAIQKDRKKLREPEQEIITKVKDEEHEDISTAKTTKDPFEDNVVDEATLKETKKQEEMAKAKLAAERKKRLAEKAAAKASIRAQKEVERKLKEQEKKAQKKTGPSINPEEVIERKKEVVELVKAELPSRPKERKKNTARPRKGYSKGQDPVPKVILKRRKSTSDWVWVALLAVFVMVVPILVYYDIL